MATLQLWALKVIFGFVIFVLTFIPSLIPFKLFSINWRKICPCFRSSSEDETDRLRDSILGHMFCFGGGVFFGTYLLHMSMESIEILAETHLGEVPYPLASLFMAIGFFVVLVCDQLVSYFRSRSHKKHRGDLEIKDVGHAVEAGHYNRVFDTQTSVNELMEKEQVVERSNELSAKNKEIEEDESHAHNHATRSIVLVIALSLHHIFEGLSIGIANDFDFVWKVSVSVIIHEIVICFSVGLQFYKSDRALTPKVFIILLITTLILPIGLFIGVGVYAAADADPENSNVVNGVLQSIATGTFIYVTFFEILIDQLTGAKSSLSRVFVTILGFTLMALLALIEPSDSGHEEKKTLCNATVAFLGATTVKN